MEKFFFSNDLYFLYEKLKRNLFLENSFSVKRTIVVPSQHTKRFLMQQFVCDPDFGCITFVEFIESENLLKFFKDLFDLKKTFPSYLELFLKIEAELKKIFSTFFKKKELNSQEDEPEIVRLVRYLQISNENFSFKSKKRLFLLCEELTQFYYLYALYEKELKIESEENFSWLLSFYKKIFENYFLPKELTQSIFHLKTKLKKEVHLFNISSFPIIFRQVFDSLPFKVYHYLLSPCLYFWEDICSEKEKLQVIKKAPTLLDADNLEKYLSDSNFLLASLGKVKKSQLKILDSQEKESFENYLDVEKDWLEESFWPSTSLLKALKQDMLALRNIEETNPYIIKKEKQSVEVHEVDSKIRELEILQDYILKKISEDNTLNSSDIIIYAPDINEYMPYIHFVFGENEFGLEYKIFDLDNIENSMIAKGIFNFFSLIKSRWEKDDLIELFENPSFSPKKSFSKNEIVKIKSWIESADVAWGRDEEHKKNILQKDLFDLHLSSWEHGFEKMIKGFVFANSSREAIYHRFIEMSMSDADLFDRFLSLFLEMKEDLTFLEEERSMHLKDWASFLKKMIEKYFFVDESKPAESQTYAIISKFIEKLLFANKNLEEKFEFFSIIKNLKKALKKDISSFNSNLNCGLSFYSLKDEILPSKIICLIGLDEEFPRKKKNNLFFSNNILKKTLPMKTDRDRNLFLDAFLLAKEKLFMSFVGRSSLDGQKKMPSTLLLEFFSYIDQAYSIEKIKFSDFIFHKHPELSFDSQYFEKNIDHLPCYSFSRFKAAKKYYCSSQNPHFFIHDLEKIPLFEKGEELLPEVIDIKSLSSLVRNPLKFYLNHVLEIYLESIERERDQKDFTLSFLDKNLILKNIFANDIEAVLSKMEKEGNFPIGIFKEIAKQKIKEAAFSIKENLTLLKVDLDKILNVELSLSKIKSLSETRKDLSLPPLEFVVGSKKVKIIGRIKNITSNGLIAFSDDKLENLLKVWPEFLIFLKIKEQIFNSSSPAILYAKNGSKDIFPDLDVDEAMILFLKYFGVCLLHLSPMIKEWAGAILSNDEKQFQKVVNQSFFNKIFEDRYFSWAFSRFENGLNPQIIYKNWNSFLKQTFGYLTEKKEIAL